MLKIQKLTIRETIGKCLRKLGIVNLGKLNIFIIHLNVIAQL